MSVGSTVFLLFIAIFAVVLGIAQQQAETQAANRTPFGLTDLLPILRLAKTNGWDVAIMRRSGYLHSSYTVEGTCVDALNLAISKLRLARIDTVSIIKNELHLFEVEAYYDSQGSRRTGKYVGGFVISPKN